MEELDLKNIWKSSQKNHLESQMLSLEDIQQYRRQKSRQTTRSTRLMFLFDIGLKSIILVGFVFILILINHQSPQCYVVGLLILLLMSLILINFRFHNQLKEIRESDSIIDNLKKKLIFHKTVYHQFLFTQALSSPLLVVAGFFLYEYYKYGLIRMGSPINDPVPYIFVLIAFCISFFAQLPVYKRQVNELMDSIVELDDVSMAMIRIEASKKARSNQIIWFSVMALVGLLIFFILMLN